MFVVVDCTRVGKRRSTNTDGGFTLFEILIVIVVLGILAAVVIYALSGIGTKSAVAACEADGSTVTSALANFNNENPTLFSNVAGTGALGNSAPGTYTSATAEALLSSTSFGGPFVQSWPNNYPHYAFQLAWTQVSTGTSSTNLGTWSETLQVATGNAQSGTSPHFTYAAAGAAGEVVAVGGSPSSNWPGTAAAPWIVYSGPGTCTGVS